MPYSPNQQMFKLLLYFKLLSHYTEKIRQSLLLTVMMSAPASPCTGVVCLHLGKWAGRGRQWGVLLGQTEERLILLLLRVSDHIPMVFILVLLCCRHFASGEGKQCVFVVGILTMHFSRVWLPVEDICLSSQPGIASRSGQRFEAAFFRQVH